MKKECFYALAVVAALGSLAVAQPAVVMDGSAADVLYPPPVVTQDNETGFGDASLGRHDVCDGSELDNAYGFVYDGWLYLVLSGNFETNGNKLELFFDSVPGQGQNQLVAENPGWALQRMGANPDDPNQPGLKFAAGFAADYWVATNVYGEDPTNVYVDYAELYVDEMNPGAVYFCGGGLSKCETDGGALTGGDAGAPGILCTVDNVNILGVVGGDSFGFPGEVLTGLELAIPLEALGNPTGSIAVCAFINGQQHDWVSNQVLGGLFGSASLEEPRLVDFSLTAHQPFVISAVSINPVGACCVGTSCSLTTQAGCGGVWLGANSNCDGNPCDAIPAGACCFDDGFSGVCEVMTESNCLEADGEYKGDGTTCAGCPCLLAPTGACCNGETCTILREDDCVAGGGDYVGNFTNCEDGPCVKGACCVGLDCSEVRDFECEDLNGNFLGAGTTCENDPCSGPTIATPHVAGSMQGWDASSHPMTETAEGSRIWELTFTELDASTRYEFKITDGTWDHSIPVPNSWLFTDEEGSVTITYDSNFYFDGWAPDRDRLGVDVDPVTWTAVGDWQSEVGGADWDNADPTTAMVAQGGGVYLYEGTGIPAGTWYWKAVKTGSWDSISWDGRSVNTADMEFETAAAGDTFKLYVDALAGAVKVEIVPGGPELCAGDVNCDGVVDYADIDPFVAALTCVGGDPSCWPPAGISEDCPWLNGDCNDDGNVTYGDIDPFVGRIGATCP